MAHFRCLFCSKTGLIEGFVAMVQLWVGWVVSRWIYEYMYVVWQRMKLFPSKIQIKGICIAQWYLFYFPKFSYFRLFAQCKLRLLHLSQLLKCFNKMLYYIYMSHSLTTYSSALIPFTVPFIHSFTLLRRYLFVLKYLCHLSDWKKAVQMGAAWVGGGWWVVLIFLPSRVH